MGAPLRSAVERLRFEPSADVPSAEPLRVTASASYTSGVAPVLRGTWDEAPAAANVSHRSESQKAESPGFSGASVHTFSLRRIGAGNGIRTRDPQLGNLTGRRGTFGNGPKTRVPG